MKIELKPRKRGGRGAVRVAAFGGSGEDEEDAARKQRQQAALAEITRESAAGQTEAGPGVGDEGGAAGGGGDDEEEEMERLRETVGFQSFASKYQRNARKPRAAEASDEEGADGGDPEVAKVAAELEREGAVVVGDAAGAANGGAKGQPHGTSLELGRHHDLEPEPPADVAEDPAEKLLPISHEAVMGEKHSATTTSISLDRAGNRVCSASLDYGLKMWDFNAMHSTLKPFRSLEPLGTFPIRHAEFSPSGGKILVAGGSNAARMLDRDGRELLVCPHGDMYLADMANTKGHVAPLSSVRWQPGEGRTFATAAADGTIRIWDATADSLHKHKKLVKVRNKRGQRVSATAIAYSTDGRRILAGCDDGGLRLYDPTSFSPRVVDEVADAHGAGVATSCVAFSSDGNNVISRTLGDALMLWDLRRFDSPLMGFDNLPNSSEQTGAVFSGDGQYIATGTSSTFKAGVDKGEAGKVVFIDRSTLRVVRETAMPREVGSVVGLQWHPEINQVIIGASNGSVRVLYSPQLSQKGVLRCVSRVVKRREESVVNVGVGKIYTPNALPMFRDEEAGNRGIPSSKKRQQEKRQEDPVLTRKPFKAHRPDVKAAAGSTLASHIAQSKVKSTWMEEDPREALLKMDNRTQDVKLFTGAYSGSDPVRVLATKTLEQEEEEERDRLRKRLPAHKQKEVYKDS
mmetsp:Transcript_7041/g.21459  ORF Transcript_7041/g.21459 Transcript_7041/m.21459 type:complete len:687 (+) Transcript_7041:388-2448(+)